MKIGLAGPGAFGIKHLDGLKNIDGADVSVIIDPNLDHAKDVAEKYGVPNAVDDLGEALQMDDLDAVILCTPTQLHAEQAIQCMEAGKHVEVEIPVADTLADAEAVDAKQKETGLVCAVGHTRRFNPSHQWVHQKIQAGELTIQQMDVQTYFFRRTNLNALGEPRTWTDHLLWHHAAHTIDLFQYQSGEKIVEVHGIQGPPHDELGIAMDMSIILRDFEHYIDNMPNPLFTQTLTSTPMAFDQYGIKIKSKTPQPQTAKALPRKSVERIGLRLMAKG